jgi:Kef-type K+ transport system membrane component KefB
MLTRRLLAATSYDVLEARRAVVAVTWPGVVELVLFLATLWAGGQAANWLRITPLVGEVLSGACLGPPLAAFQRFPPALQLFGELGLILSIVEAGLRVQLGVVRQVGLRGLSIALLGSLVLPVPVATLVAWGIFNCTLRESLAVALCFVPSSSNVAVLILSRKQLLNTPIGQTILAATFFDDVLALIGISELRALQNSSVRGYLEPIVGFALTGVIGGASIWAVPRLLTRVLPLLPPRMVIKGTLCALAAISVGLMWALEHLRSSYLLGAFLGGLSLCTLPTVLHVWAGQVKRLQTWLLRLFFGATVAFELPLRSWRKPRVIAFAAALLIPLLGKAATGVLAKSAAARDRAVVSFSMVTIGELAFVAAVVGHHELHETSADTFAAVVLAILASNVFGPALLRRTLRAYAAASRSELAAVAVAAASSGSSLSQGLRLRLRCRSRWGLLADVLRALADSHILVLEFRVDTVEDDALYEAYLKADGSATEEDMHTRLALLRTRLAPLLSHDAGAQSSLQEDANGAAEGECEDDSGETMDWASLRGMQLRAWDGQGVRQADMPPPSTPSRRIQLSGALTASMAAAVADMALADAAEQEDLERARTAAAASLHGLRGFVRSERVPELDLQSEDGVELTRR